ncbi:hypothetical protein SBA3_980017 [Candidatus Sulfopaludibacter sp. SbA3]|nr:hypothetical protein SBA3_980017 [Candidatus Sulfopaludibacter sp. SbA3]
MDMGLPECEECRAILKDYWSAWRAVTEEMRASHPGTEKEFAQVLRQARMMRTEDDVVLAEKVFPAVHLKSSAKVGLAIGRKFAHQARSGHKVDWRPGAFGR